MTLTHQPAFLAVFTQDPTRLRWDNVLAHTFQVIEDALRAIYDNPQGGTVARHTKDGYRVVLSVWTAEDGYRYKDYCGDCHGPLDWDAPVDDATTYPVETAFNEISCFTCRLMNW